MELTTALDKQTFQPMSLSSARQNLGREYISPPTHQIGTQMKITTGDWELHNNHMTTMGYTRRNEALSAAEIARSTSDAVALRTDRKHALNTQRLVERMTTVERQTHNLKVAKELLDTEISALECVKTDTEKMLENMSKPLEVAKQCLEIREQRRTSDAVRDLPEAELFKEVRLIERIKGALSSKVQQNFNQLTVLRHCRAKIQADVMDKSRAHGIDTTCKNLSDGEACYRYDYKPALHNKLGSTPDGWRNFSEQNCALGAKEREISRNLREQSVQCQNACACDLKAQNNSVDSALRVRLNEVKQAHNELAFNQKETLLQIQHAEREIENLKQAIQNQVKPMQIAETRIAYRESRPNVELCHDHVENGIKDQLHTLTVDTQKLQFQLEKMHEKRTDLRKALCRIEDDLATKALSIELDQQCLKLRSQ